MEVQNNAQNDVKPDSWLVWSILATILCCLPFGIVGIVFASKVDGLWAAGQTEQAVEMAGKAKMWTIVSICCGLGVALIYGIMMAFGIGAGLLGGMGLS